MTPYTLHQGDCRDVMAGMEADSVDAIVCDPPYGLRFMGKGWDHGVPGVEFWQAAKRVAKPGAHLLAFGGTRTFHRLTVAIEDAGWEIRDCIFWCFGSGFPKSLNISKDTRFCQCSAVPYNSENSPETRTQVRDLRDGVSPSTLVGEEEPRAILQSTLLRHSSRTSMGKAGLNGSGALDGRKPTELQNEDYRPIEPGVERRSDLLQDAWELPGGAVRQSARMGEANGEGGRLRDGASADHGRVVRIPTDANGSGEPPRSQSGEQHEDEPRTVADECGPQAGRGWPVCSRCGKQDLTGVGTALKPAFEPVIVARKPLAGTVAQNVQRYGTGGINVDACRIGHDEPEKLTTRTAPKFNGNVWAQDAYSLQMDAGNRASPDPLGRWPANLIHDGSEDVVSLFPEATSAYPGNPERAESYAGTMVPGGLMQWTNRAVLSRSDSGSAARFFQQCKGSTIESWIDLGIANIAETLSTQQRQVAASALALVASEALDVDGLSISVSLAPSTAATASEFATISASVTRTIQSIGSRFWHELEPLRLTLTSNLVEAAVTREPTGTTTITLSRWKSDGSAEPVTFSIMRPNSAHGEAASASRLIYTAKASREDREEGLESLPLRSAGEATDRVDGSAGLNSPRAGASRTNGARNHHPTVKPTSLMRYLCRLVTPRDGIVLDPFMGSGSTGKAAILEGFRFIGIDLEPEYVEIARARCEWAMAQPRQLALEETA